MYYVVGLGNPGKKYTNTRHNIGWMVLDTFREQHGFGAVETAKRHHASVAQGQYAGHEVWCVYPQTFMNRSGEAVRSLWRETPEATVIVVHDDVALPVGEMKVSYDRGHGGHNGIRSIIQQCKTTAFVRIRLGVASRAMFSGAVQVPQGADLPTHVLGTFSFFERKAVATMRADAAAAISTTIADGYEAAMNQYN